ncbi:MAG: 30S ribosomal protein S19 [Candidatus ainarchaeum sp.]|nr:30S ribosomal protein S19 [Candidatus ainarchaeum sp.]
MAKVFNFQGKTVEELKGLSVQEFSRLVNSRARRTLLRGFDKTLDKALDRALAEKGKGREPKPVRTHLRDAIVVPKMIGLKIAVHKGNSFETVEVKPEMLGHYLGEFALTRKRLIHGKAGIGATKSSTAITARG